MNVVVEKIEKIVKQAFVAKGYDSKYGEVSVSNRRDLGQFQCNGALLCGKDYKKSPLIIAKEVLNLLNENEIFENINVANPGFLNITLKDEVIVEVLKKVNKENNFALIKNEKIKTIVIDYAGPNIAKPLHIGHLRSAIIGDSIKRISRQMGHNVIGDIHLGDWGLQMGLVMAQMEDEIPGLKEYDGNGNFELNIGLNNLNEWYPKASKRSKEDEEFKEVASSITYKLQHKDKKYYSLWKIIAALSTKDLKRNYDEMGVSFDIWLGESDADEYAQTLFDILEEQNLLYESEGALVVDVSMEDDDHVIPPVLIKKRNGASLYATTDLATIIQRKKDFNLSDIYYVVDNRQEMHFKQVFRCAKKASIVDESVNLEFVGFGTMNGKDGKPYKTRDGGVLKLEDLINKVVEEAREKISFLNYDENEKEVIAKRVGMAALKFGDLINYRGKDYVFDLDRFLSFEGKTGPYLLYTIARINSILAKANIEFESDVEYLIPSNDEERDLMLNLLFVNDSFENAFKEKAPHYIADCVYNLCVVFNKFYASNKIIIETNQSKKDSWLKLLRISKEVIELQLNMLGIETVDRM